jgi:parallel beta-helix repeat protein
MLESRCLLAEFFVASTGNDASPGTIAQPFATIQHALDMATSARDIVTVRAGTYGEHVEFPASGTATGGHITLRNFAGERPVLNGVGLPADHMVLIENRSFVKLIGFEITGLADASDHSGVRIEGAGTNIEIRNNKIHNLRGTSAMGITVYGTSTRAPVANLVIDGNEIYDSEPAPSEALTLNGNVTGFAVTNNLIHDVNNIGIDLIAGERDINRRYGTRVGVVRGNEVYRARSNYEDGFAAGIYIDGASDVVVENNIVHENDVGIEVGAENRGITASRNIVRNNLIYDNDKAGLAFGGYASSRGRVRYSKFINNTVYHNDTLGAGFGQLWIQYASNNVVANNIFWAAANQVLIASDAGNVLNTVDYNLYFSDAGAATARFTWNRRAFTGFAAYRTATRQDAHSQFTDPLFVSAAARDFHLNAGSPAIDAGSRTTGQFAAADFDGKARPQGVGPDIGAFER